MRWKARYLLFAVAGLFAFGFIDNTVHGTANPGDAAAQWSIIALALAAYWFAAREERSRDELLAFLRANLEAVRAGTAVYRGHSVSYATRLRTCQIVVSFLVLTFRLPSRLIVDGSESDRGVRSGCSLVSFVFGWWGIPFGPIWTIRALSSNIHGGDVITVGELLEGKSSVQVPVAVSRR